MPKSKRITIVSMAGHGAGVNPELQWLSKSLGMFGKRDKERSCFRIFVGLLKAAKLNKPVSSDELAYRLNLSRGTVIHHINKLIESGIVIQKGKGYMLRAGSLDALIGEVKKDINEILSEMQKVAKSIDKALGTEKGA